LLELLPKGEQERIQKAAEAAKEYNRIKNEIGKVKNTPAYHKLVGELEVAKEKASKLNEELLKA
jgi:predicted  nucleic acid-binding Zn-ribbon protein